MLSKLQAGFPSPGEEFVDERLDLNSYLIPHPTATFFIRVEGDSMTGAGIFSGDLLIVDRSLTAKSESIVVAVLDGEFTVKRLIKEGEKLLLLPENPRYAAIPIAPGRDFQVWGVVTYVIHPV